MEGWTWDHYNVSVPMSTYIVAFVVSDFEYRMANRSLSKPEFRVWARKDAIDQAEYAKDIGPRILTYYEEYFNITFPLPKQDMIALPDFGAGYANLIKLHMKQFLNKGFLLVIAEQWKTGVM